MKRKKAAKKKPPTFHTPLAKAMRAVASVKEQEDLLYLQGKSISRYSRVH